MSDNKRQISLARQYLTYCVRLKSDLAFGLWILSDALNGDNQHEEALAVANRCLQINDATTQLPCTYDRALGLYGLGRIQETKATIETGLKQPAITEADATVKQTLQAFLADVNTALKTLPQPEPPPGDARPTQQRSSNQVASGESARVTGGVSCPPVRSGDTESLGGHDININGTVDSATVDRVSKLFDELHEHERKEKARLAKCHVYGTRYEINSRGGSVSAAMAIGRIFRKERAALFVDGTCISACVLILAGAIQREIGDSAVVGIHRPYLGTTPQRSVTTDQVKNAYRAVLQDMRAYLREMNVTERLADDMLATEPESAHILTQAELKAYGLSGVDPAEQQGRAIDKEARDVQEASQLGLDRREYTRRKALGESLCPVTDAEWWKCRQRVMRTGQR
jgi:hypothetical protein